MSILADFSRKSLTSRTGYFCPPPPPADPDLRLGHKWKEGSVHEVTVDGFWGGCLQEVNFTHILPTWTDFLRLEGPVMLTVSGHAPPTVQLPMTTSGEVNGSRWVSEQCV